MPLTATCPKCATSSAVPEEAVGRKVRCKRCQNIFVVEPAAVSQTTPSPTHTPSPNSSAVNQPKAASRPPSKPPSSAGGRTKPAPKAQSRALWTILGVLLVMAVAGGGFVVYLLSQPEAPPRQAKANAPKKETVAKAPADKRGKAPTPAPAPADENGETKSGRGRPAKAKERDLPEFKAVEPVAIAPLLHGARLEAGELTDVHELVTVAGKPSWIGVRLIDKGQTFFELHDLAKPDRLARIKLPKNPVLVDVDPEGKMLAIADIDKRLHLYELPTGTELLEDDWAPYDNIKDEARFLGDGKMTSIALLDNSRLMVLTTRNLGDVWDTGKPKVVYHIPPPPREDFRNEAAAAGKDFVLSPDRSVLAFASDAGIEFFDTKDRKPLGKTPKLTRHGTKLEPLGMGIDPTNTRLGIFLAANQEKGRVFLWARFKIPEGEEIDVQPIADPGSMAAVEYVSGDLFVSPDRRLADLRDGTSKAVALCGFPLKYGLFAPHVVAKKLAYVYRGEKEKPTLGLAEIPSGGSGGSPATKGGSNSLAAALGVSTTNVKARTFDRQELWEFGPQGILKKGERAFDAK